MEQQTKIIQYRVGIFVVISTLLAVFFIMVLGGDKAFFKRNDILHMKVDEGGGLYIGSAVTLSGISVGNVAAITFDPEGNKLNVSLKIEHSYMSRITKGSAAGVRTQGALGDKYVSITPGPFTGEPLKDGETIDTETEGDFLSTLGRSGNKLEKAFQIIDNVEKFTRALNDKSTAQNMGDTFRNLKSTSGNLDEIMASLKGPGAHSNKVKSSLDHLASILEKIDSGKGTLGGLINDPTIHEDLKSVLGGAKRSKLLKYLIRQTIQKSEEEEEKPSSQK